MLVNKLSFKEVYANLTLNAQVNGLIDTNSWTGYHWIDNLPLNFIKYSSLCEIYNEFRTFALSKFDLNLHSNC